MYNCILCCHDHSYSISALLYSIQKPEVKAGANVAHFPRKWTSDLNFLQDADGDGERETKTKGHA